MKKRYGTANIYIKIVTSLCVYLLSYAAHAELPASVADALKQSGIPQASVGIYVQAVDETQPVIAHNPETSMNPASVMKLITTNAALDLLTPAYRWKTEIYHDGDLLNGVLHGNLIIKGYGDPSFKAQDFWRLLMALQQADINEIKGDLIIDKTVFAKNMLNQPPFDEEIWRAYNAKSSAFLVDGRRTSFKFSATDAGVNISQEFELNEVEIVNKMLLSQTACGDWRNRFSYSVKPQSKGVSVTFEGVFSPDCGERYLELSILNDEQYAFFSFKKLWRELGGVFSGNLKIQQLPDTSTKVVEQVSEPLAYVIRDMNKWSNNLTARQLLLTLAAEKLGLPATEAKGAIAVQRWLQSKNIDAKELVIENGSGLSRIERVSSQHLGQILVSAYHSPVMPELIASLPILGLDGTAQKRLNNSEAQNRVHLKTGSLDGVSAVGGYVLNKNNKRYVLVMMVNDVNAAMSKTAQDALIKWIYIH
ncbi:MAG: D-alanyl-D-alanine carboxypeptidase/D-alanyl-D-alanine-endopeptidase [Pseudomonadota bacterium]